MTDDPLSFLSVAALEPDQAELNVAAAATSPSVPFHHSSVNEPSPAPAAPARSDVWTDAIAAERGLHAAHAAKAGALRLLREAEQACNPSTPTPRARFNLAASKLAAVEAELLVAQAAVKTLTARSALLAWLPWRRAGLDQARARVSHARSRLAHARRWAEAEQREAVAIGRQKQAAAREVQAARAAVDQADALLVAARATYEPHARALRRARELGLLPGAPSL